MFHMIPGVAFIFNHNPSLWQIMIKYSCRDSITAYFYPSYLFSRLPQLCRAVLHYIFVHVWIIILQGQCWRKNRCAVNMTAKVQSSFVTYLLHMKSVCASYTIRLQIWIKTKKTLCHSVCSCTYMLYAHFFTVHQADFKLTEDKLYLVVFLSSSAAAKCALLIIC